jgi:hypothetical protein
MKNYDEDDKIFSNEDTSNTFIKTNIKIKNLEKSQNERIEGKSKPELKAYLAELEKELYHLLIFDDEPKMLLKAKNKTEVNHHNPGAYYNPTEADKEKNINELRNKIMEIRRHLKLSEKIEFQINFKNNTFPANSNDAISNYEHLNEEIIKKNKRFNKLNGDYETIQDLYKTRTNHLKSNNEAEWKNKFSNLNQKNNQILDYINKRKA